VGLAKLAVFQVAENLKGSPLRRVKPAAAALMTEQLALELKLRAAVVIRLVPTAMATVRANPVVIAAIPALYPAG
jgi:hypothetical protein